MVLQNKNILLISTEPWSHLHVSKHHYAINLAQRGNTVFFLNPPEKKKTFKITETEYQNLFSIHYSGFIKGLRKFPAFLQKFFMRRKFSEIEIKCGIKFDVVWSFDNSLFFNFDGIPDDVVCISHIVDMNQNFNFTKACRTADVCFAVTNEILNLQKRFNHHSYKINHGYNIPGNPKKVTLPGAQRLKCFYAGNLDIQYLDWEVLMELVTTFPHVDFVFAGSWKDDKRKKALTAYPNFHYLGILHSNELNNYYSSSDILLIFYYYEKFPDQLTNSHKIMEYLGSGKIIVSNWLKEYMNQLDLFEMAEKRSEIKTIFKEVADNIDLYNSADRMKARIEFALNNTYYNQINRIERILSSVKSKHSKS